VSDELYCPECRLERALVVPECGEGHDADCPDRVCVVCGYAVFLGAGPLALEQDRPEPARRIA